MRPYKYLVVLPGMHEVRKVHGTCTCTVPGTVPYLYVLQKALIEKPIPVRVWKRRRCEAGFVACIERMNDRGQMNRTDAYIWVEEKPRESERLVVKKK